MRLLALAFGLLLAGCQQEQPAPPPEPPPKVTLAEFAQAGMPSASEPWGPSEYKTAFQILIQVAQQRPHGLPKLDDLETKALFARIANPANLATGETDPIKQFPLLLDTADAINGILKIY